MLSNIRVFALLIILFFGCSTSEPTENSFVGKWSVESCHITSESLSPSLISGAAAEANASTYIFKDDQSFILDVATNQEHASGTWSFNTAQATLTLSFLYEEDHLKEEVKEVYSVEQIEGLRLKLHQEMGDLGTIDMVLRKN